MLHHRFLLLFFFATLSSAGLSQSADAYYNDAVKHSHAGDFEAASESLLRSISQEANPLILWEGVELLETFQRRLGIPQSATGDSLARISLLSTPPILLAAGLFLFWTFFLYFYLKTRHHKKHPVLLFLSVGISLVLLADFGILYQVGKFGILSAKPEKEIAVYRSQELKESIISLPAGTVVSGKCNGAYFQINEPVAGWVSQTQVSLIAGFPFD